MQKLSNDIDEIASVLLTYREQSKAAKEEAARAASERKAREAAKHVPGHRSTRSRIQFRRNTVAKAKQQSDTYQHQRNEAQDPRPEETRENLSKPVRQLSSRKMELRPKQTKVRLKLPAKDGNEKKAVSSTTFSVYVQRWCCPWKLSVTSMTCGLCRYKMRLVQEGVTVLVKAPWHESRTHAHMVFGVGNIEVTVSAEGEVCFLNLREVGKPVNCWSSGLFVQLSTQSSIGVGINRVACSVHTPTDAIVQPTATSAMMKGLFAGAPRSVLFTITFGCFRVCVAHAANGEVSNQFPAGPCVWSQLEH